MITAGINYEIVIGGEVGWVTIVIGGVLAAYGDMRYRVGKLEGQMGLISRNVKVIMNNNKVEK
ncbi:unnamed protein product [marine sediment metagenome]|uniref:Uncharacterized protein n=1 Tax=marine sediment metagenome TaxID=412755 RepID=X1R069_9ZZZZ